MEGEKKKKKKKKKKKTHTLSIDKHPINKTNL